MTIIKIEPHENGGHDNQTINGATPATFPIPEGYALIPEELGTPETLENYPFGEITVRDMTYVFPGREVNIPTVTSWSPLPIPDPPPAPPPEPTLEDRMNAMEEAMLAIMTEV